MVDSRLVDKYFSFVDEISLKYMYDSNIKHLLYLIIPAFVTKYSIYKENLILNVFRNIPIIISKERDKQVQAFYTSIPRYQNDKIVTNKYIVLKNYQDISLVHLLDDLVHEFNHAINSYQKEILIKDNTLYLRTGLSYASYSISKFNPIKKDDSYMLEEILNTNQTEDVINLIKNYQDPNHVDLNNTVYSLNHETDEKYSSQAYYLENLLMKSILENKTFISTLNNLRLTGDVEDIEYWFDNICGKDNSYHHLINYLKDMNGLEEKLVSQKIFKNRTINKIKELIQKILAIIQTFNNNCNYK